MEKTTGKDGKDEGKEFSELNPIIQTYVDMLPFSRCQPESSSVFDKRSSSEASDTVCITSHRLYHELLQTYIECYKVGVNDQKSKLLDDLLGALTEAAPSVEVASHEDLDVFMADCLAIMKSYKSEVQKFVLEARNICANFEENLKQFLVSPASAKEETTLSGNSSGGHLDASPDDRMSNHLDSVDPTMNDEDLKKYLKVRYSSYLSSLKQDYLKKKKKGKLPKSATEVLHSWWQEHVAWPYPSEPEKSRLAEMTGLDAKQINNWFINQRKRHWVHGSNQPK